MDEDEQYFSDTSDSSSYSTGYSAHITYSREVQANALIIRCTITQYHADESMQMMAIRHLIRISFSREAWYNDEFRTDTYEKKEDENEKNKTYEADNEEEQYEGEREYERYVCYCGYVADSGRYSRKIFFWQESENSISRDEFFGESSPTVEVQQEVPRIQKQRLDWDVECDGELSNKKFKKS
ncbi:Hypothetical protein CINCED_3A004622 [Cinara cedri]|uniref:Uncharacterized protein n=1 Tax=Cinara cedri TaxID=506608 RepID=A0A5E4MZM8_9HEMI|nr:Hypothetical protein CINCED_3A004622 [Cinara cedri]